ncbi:MAG: tetratricopeptide repeat protein [Bacteroidales bacterium]|nr:tetratricopeptide repeat protein [Bacteroidales bacterium]
MKRYIVLFAAICLTLVSCGPSRHAVNVEMRYPGKAGVDLAGKIVSVVYLENGNPYGSVFNEAMADAFAYTLEQDYGTGEGSIGIYRMLAQPGVTYASKDSLFNILMDTGSDVVFLFDTLKFGQMNMGGVSKVASPVSADSSYVSTGTVQFTMKLYSFDGMDKKERVQQFGGTSTARSDVYSNGQESSAVLVRKAWENLSEAGWYAGIQIAGSFKSQWKHEQYSLIYYDNEKWYKALDKAEVYDWKGAMDIWISLLASNDMLKRACAEYNISVACYMLGDYQLASEWLDRSDADSQLPQSDAMRKRINARLN